MLPCLGGRIRLKGFIKTILSVHQKQMIFFKNLTKHNHKSGTKRKALSIFSLDCYFNINSCCNFASFVPALEYHHWAFIIANSLWVVVGILLERDDSDIFKCWLNDNLYSGINVIKI